MGGRSRVLEISTAPFLREGTSTERIMWEVVLVLVPVILVAVFYFGMSALLVLVASTAGALLPEWLLTRNRGDRADSLGRVGPVTGAGLGRPEAVGIAGARRPRIGTLGDGSALLTGLLLGLTLPPAIPMWMAFLGGLVAISLGKLVWGGLGHNLFNPALVGRAFMQGAFPDAMTTWVAPSGKLFSVFRSTVAWPFLQPAVDLQTSASPLGLAKFDQQGTDLVRLLFGNISGCIGETCGLLLLVCAVWLAVRRIFDWRLCAATLLAAGLCAAILHLVSPDDYEGPLFMLFSGGLMFGAAFMCTDPVTTPITTKGVWIFGLGVGFLVILLRVFGGLPESVMYSILLMNAVTPLINRKTQPRQFGEGR